MLKTELKAYVSVIKGLAKNRVLKNIAIRDNTVQASDLDSIYTLKLDIEGSGVYNPKSLDLYLLNQDISAYREKGLEDWIEMPKITWGKSLDLNLRHSRGTNGEEIIYALGFVSQDTARPAITAVHIKNSEIMATDGYRVYTSGRLGELEEDFLAALPAPLLKTYKRLHKYGTWTLTIGTDPMGNNVVKLANEHIELATQQTTGEMPNIRELVDKNREFNYKVIIPYDKVKPLQDKDNDDLEIFLDGTMALGSRQLPFKAKIEQKQYKYDPLDDRRGLIMGRNTSNPQALCKASLRLLSDFRPQAHPEGFSKEEMVLRVNKNPMGTDNLCFAVGS